MRRLLKLLIVVDFIIFSIALSAKGTTSPGSEIGDAVFRPIVWPLLQHTGIYRNSDSRSITADWDPSEDMLNSDIQHSVIQTSGSGEVVGLRTFNEFLYGHIQLGKGYTSPNISLDKRKIIINTAKSQYGAEYPEFPDEWVWPAIKAPKGHPDYPKGSFRCDGLVEYSYEQVYHVDTINPDDGGFFTREEETHCMSTFKPSALHARMTSEAPQPPAIDVSQPQYGEVIEDSVEIAFTTEDIPIMSGSGIDRVEILIDGIPEDSDFFDYDTDSVKQISYTWDASDASYGFHYITIGSYDRAGNLAEERIKVYKGEAPFVVSTVPYDGAQDVAIDTTISITFSAVMDQMTTSGAVSIEPNVSFTPFWWSPDGMTLDLDLNDNLDYCQENTVTITDAAMNIDGIHLDGNGNGEPGGDYSLSFNTQPPPLTHQADPPFYLFIPPGGSIGGNVRIDGSALKKEVSGSVSKTVTGNVGALTFGGGEGGFTIGQGESYNIPFTVSSFSSGKIDVKLHLLCGCRDTTVSAHYAAIDSGSGPPISGGAGPPGHPGYDHPDDNQSPGEVSYPTTWRIESDSIYGEARVGIFVYGWTPGFGHLLGRYGISTIPVFSDLTYWKNPKEELSDVIDLLVIGSGALSGFDSPEFGQNLQDYVINGGDLLVLTQKFGSDLSALPGGIDGYGWSEDQSCFRNAAYLNQWHPVFSGQTKQVMSCNVDGYITQYPGYADVLLRRTANGMPALLSYNYGAGTVIVSSLYPDWGYGHNQTSEEELRLLRDITTWALNPEMSIPEFYPDSNVTVPVSIQYIADDTVEATTAIVKVFIPNRDLYDSVAVLISLQPGEEIQWDWNESSLPRNLGLWVIDYALMNSNAQRIQGYKRGAIFAERKDVPTGDYNLGDFLMWVNSDYEEIPSGDTVNFEISVRNNTDSLFVGKVIVGVNHATHVVDSIIGLSVPSDTVIKIIYQNPQRQSHLGGLFFGLYASDQFIYRGGFGNALSRCDRRVREISHPFSVSLSKDKNSYLMGYDTVHYVAELGSEMGYPCSLRGEIYTTLNSIRYDIRIDTISLKPIGKTIEGEFFPADYDSTAYWLGRLYCDLYYKNNLKKSGNMNYPLIFPEVRCSLALPDSFNYFGANPYTVTLHSEGDYLPLGKLLVTGKDYYDSLWINSSPNPETTLTFNYQPDIWHLNDWIKVEYRYGEQVSSVKKSLGFSFPQFCWLLPDYNRVPGSFKAYGWAKFSTKVRGRGKIIGAPFSAWLYGCPPDGDTLRDTVIVNPDSTSYISVSTYIDTILDPNKTYDYSFGYKYLNKEEIFRTVRGGYIVRRPQVGLVGAFCSDTFSITEKIPVVFANNHLQSTSISIDSFRLFGNGVSNIEPGPGLVDVPAEGIYRCSIDVPEWVSGEYRMSIFGHPTEEGWRLRGVGGVEGYPIYIDGIESQLTVNSEKDWFERDEDKIFTSNLLNGEIGYQAAETISVYPFAEEAFTCTLELPYSDTLLYGIGFEDTALIIVPYYSLRSIARYSLPAKGGDEFLLRTKNGGSFPFVDPQGNIWTVDGWLKTFYKYDHNFSELLNTFILPDSVGLISGAAMKDGWIYAVDPDNGVIRKINSISGELVDSWGEELMYPMDITINQSGNLLVIDNGTKNLWKFTTAGDSISTYQFPSSHYYLDIDHYNGKTYLCCDSNVITLQDGVVDSFGISGSVMGYSNIAVSEEGKIAVRWISSLEKSYITLFNSLEEEEATTGGVGRVAFDSEDILCFGNNYVTVYREFGVDKGMILYPKDMFDGMGLYTFLDYHPWEDLGIGSIAYKGTYGNIREGTIPLEQFEGTHNLPSIAVTLTGNTEEPRFMGMGLEMSMLSKDSLVQQWVYNPVVSPYENYITNDTITDSLIPGDYVVIGGLYTDIGQLVNSDIGYFTVIGDEISLIMHPDTNDVPPGWTFQPNIQVINPLSDSEENLHLIVKTEDSVYIETTFGLDPLEVNTFLISLNPITPTVLSGELILPTNDTIRKDITLNVIGGIITLEVTAPDYAGLVPFEVNSKMENHSAILQEVVLKRAMGSDSIIDTLLIPPGGEVNMLDSLSITRSEILNVIASGGFGKESEELPISFGLKGDLSLDTLYQVAPDSVEMRGVVRNDGVYPVNLMALFCLLDAGKGSEEMGTQPLRERWEKENVSSKGAISGESILIKDRDPEIPLTEKRDVYRIRDILHTRKEDDRLELLGLGIKRLGKDLTVDEFIEKVVKADIDTSLFFLALEPGRADTIPIMFDFHNPGNYRLQGFLFTDTPSIFLDSVSSFVNVMEKSLVFIDSISISPLCDSNGYVPLSVFLSNESCNSFYGDLSLSSPIFYLDTTVELYSQIQDTNTFLLTELVDEGKYNFTVSLKEGGLVLDKKERELVFNPIYQIDSMPDEVSISAGDTGKIYLQFSNVGNCRGIRKVSVDWVDVINLTIDTTLNPGNSAYLTQDFYIPLDMPGGRYYCNVAILDGAYPEVDTFFPVVVEGVSITAKDSLDRMVYQIGDTADFSILIWNETSWSGSLDASIQYADFFLDTSFILGGMEKGIVNTSFPRDTLYFDTSGVYIFDPFNTVDYDSVQFNWSTSSESLFLYFRTDTVIGGGKWITIDSSLTYSIYEWTQIRIMNESADTERVDSLVLFYYPNDTIILDTFPLQREKIQFELSVTENKKRAGWGIYHPTGRSIVLDERYVYLMDDSLTIFTDKARYELLDTVNVTLWKHFPGSDYDFHYYVYFSPTEVVEDSFPLTKDTTEFSFPVSRWVRSGGYSIDYWVMDNSKEYGEDRDIISVNGQKEGIKKHPAKEWVEGEVVPERNNSALLAGSHSFDVSGITVYFKNAFMDTNWYQLGDTARIWMEISSDVNLDCSLILSSTGTVVDTVTLSLYEDVPNRYEFEYPLSGCYRGMNELYLHIMKDLMSLAGDVLYFDIYIPDSIPPMISIVEEPPNTYSSSRLYKVRAYMWNPDSNDTPIYDTLYYRLSSIGGAGWQRLLSHSIKGDTHQYLIPSQPNGSHIEFHLNVRDESGNLGRYPERGERGFWVFSPMRPTWSELTYTCDTTATLHWNPPKELVSYHCGLNSNFIPLWERTVATRFIPQYLPAKLNKIGISLTNGDAVLNGEKHTKEELGFYLDTFVINIYEAIDSLPGNELYSYSFIKILSNYEVFNIPGVQVPEEGLFVGIWASSEVYAILDGFGKGTHTALYSDDRWSLNTAGEVLMDGFLSYIPSSEKSQSSILSFNLLRKSGDENWTELTSGIVGTTFVDSVILENKEYYYEVEANFSNPADTFSSVPRSLFIDLKPPMLDTVILSSIGDTVLLSATLLDTSGILWDSLGYKTGESLLVISEDSCAGVTHFFSIPFTEDTLYYYLIVCDSSLIGNYVRYPATGFYHWVNPAGIPEYNFPDSTYLANLPQSPVTRGTELKYALARSGHVKIVLYDVVGRMINVLLNDIQEKGYYSVPLDVDGMPQGVYFLRMRAGEYQKTIKLVKLM